jgi:hypothetical protein
VYVGRECIAEARRQVMLNYPNGTQVERLVRVLEAHLIPTLEQLGAAEPTDDTRTMASALREWMGWKIGEQQ